jgi:hypothetical protein
MKPGDFLLSALDFFAILLPGAIATWLVSQYAPADIANYMRPGSGEADAALRWTVFLLGSYMFGHFVFMIGSNLDAIYDLWRRRTKVALSNSTYLAAEQLRDTLTKQLKGSEFTPLKWAKSYIQIHSPQARVDIDRLEANSKFFRGMVVISVVLIAHFLLSKRSLPMAAAAALVGMLSFSRFCSERWKMTELSYGTAVVLHETRSGDEVRGRATPRIDVTEEEDARGV